MVSVYQLMRYGLCAVGLIALVVAVGRTSPLAAWDWRSEVPVKPAPPPKQSGENEDKPIPLVGRWFSQKNGPRLIEFKETGRLIDSKSLSGGLQWKIYSDKKGAEAKQGGLGVSEISLRVDLKNFPLPRERAYVCTFDTTKERDKKLIISHGVTEACDLQGDYVRVLPEKASAKAKIARTWLDLESGRSITFRNDEKVVADSSAEGYLHPGQWSTIPRTGLGSTLLDVLDTLLDTLRDTLSNFPDNVIKSLAVRAVEKGTLVVTVGGFARHGSRIVACSYENRKN